MSVEVKIVERNDDLKPFAWTKTADEILERMLSCSPTPQYRPTWVAMVAQALPSRRPRQTYRTQHPSLATFRGTWRSVNVNLPRPTCRSRTPRNAPATRSQSDVTPPVREGDNLGGRDTIGSEQHNPCPLRRPGHHCRGPHQRHQFLPVPSRNPSGARGWLGRGVARLRRNVLFPVPARRTVRAVVGLEIERAHHHATGVIGHGSQSRPAIPDGRISRVRL